MFMRFFTELRQAKVPVTLKEYLMLMEALDKGVIDRTVEDFYFLSRTALVKDGVMYVQAGAGIVADSDPEFEQQECINKARALFRAAEEATRFASAARRGQ